MTIAVCVKWVNTFAGDDDRFARLSAADAAALEWALRTADAWADTVTVITSGPVSADAALRDGLAAGATTAIRIDLPLGADSSTVAAAISAEVASCGLVWCGDYSLDRGSGSVPAYLAAHLQAAQALGIVDVEISDDGSLSLLRRLDGGRRERLAVEPRPDRPAVVSVEGSTARLRRASLRATLAADDAPITIRTPTAVGDVATPSLRPYRPRARVLPAPAGETALDRLRLLTDASDAGGRGETVELDPAAAADRILAALAEWGEFPL
jgi:electron transfer flavoprotein beta subunit